MKPFLVKTREIYVGGSQRESLCDTFIYEPSNIEEEGLGNLYITGELNLANGLKDEGLSYLVNLLASIIKREYYSNSKREPLKSLELALKKANTTLNDLAEKGNTDWIGNLHLISGCLAGKTLHLACSGNAKGILLRKGVLTDIGQIIPGLAPGGMPFKTFTNVASGDLEEGDLIIFSTPVFFEIINPKQLKLFGSESSIDKISQKIQEMLREELNEKNLALGAIILKIESQKQVSSTASQKGFYQAQTKLIQESPEEPEEKEGKEKKELTPQRQRNAFAREKLVKVLSQIFFILRKSSFILGKLLLFAAKYLVKEIKNFSSKLLRGLQKLILFLIIKGKRFYLIILKKLPVNRLPSSSKILLAVSILLAILLGVSLGIIYKKRVFELNFKQYGGLLEQAYQKEGQAEAALIYQDEQKARILLMEARGLLGTVLGGSDYFKKEAEKLLRRIENQADSVDKIVRLPEPKLISDFSQSEFTPQQIIGLGNELYIVDLQNSFYRLDLKNLESLKLKINFTNIGHLKDGVAMENSIVFYTDTPGIAIFNKSQSTIEPVDVSIWQPPLSQGIKAVAKYYSNIYLLDPGQNQIWKSYKILAGFSNPRAWLKEEINLDGASSLAIDGAIYVLKENGEILKYVQGKMVEFKNPELFNSLKWTIKIFTAPSFKNLYIIDQGGKIVVVLDKKGNLIKQYFSEKFDNLKDMFVSDDESKIFLLNGSKIFELSI